jgi:ribosomal protein L12E/L44/L45/RPP1/RPP2
VAAVADLYDEEQILNGLVPDSAVDSVELTLTGDLADQERIDQLVEAINGVDNVEVVNDVQLITTTTTAAPRPATTRRPTPTTARPAPTTAPQPTNPIDTNDTNPGLG